MPMCAVGSCRSDSRFMKKSEGITFHKFPSANEVWKEDWVQIIRESRNEPNWNPSSFSVICSKHFETNDLYKTKGGLLRVAVYAVPKKLLTIQDKRPSKSVKDLQESSSGIVYDDAAPTSSGQPSAMDQSCVDSTSTSSSQNFEFVNLQEEEPAETNVSNASQDVETLVIKLEDTSSEQILDQPHCPSTTSVQQTSSNTEAPAFDFEQPGLEPDSPRTLQLKYHVKKMASVILNQRSRIKMLNQKVRRLQIRNKKLKDTLKELVDSI